MTPEASEQCQTERIVQGERQATAPGLRPRTKVAQAVEKAGKVFARRSLPVRCETDDVSFMGLPTRGPCEKLATWLAVYRKSESEPWRADFLCARCKKEVQRLRAGNLEQGESLVLVKDWRV